MLRFLHSIENLNDSQLQKKVANKISVLEKKSKKNCPDVIELGYQVGNQPLSHFSISEEFEPNKEFIIICLLGQFARLDTKMIYGLTYNKNGTGFNSGNYYYMDNQDYLYDFCKFVKDKEIEDECEFFEYVRDFLHNYFGHIKRISRDEMHNLILNKDECFYDPVREHSITDFKGKGNAMCSEYALMAHNILKLFDFDSFFIVGNVLLDGENSLPHAYNLVTFTECNTGNIKHAVLDFINDVDVFDINYNKIGKVPFMGFIPKLDLDIMEQLINGDLHFKFDEYCYMIVGDTVLKLGLENRERDYFIDNYIYTKQSVNCHKIYAKK